MLERDNYINIGMRNVLFTKFDKPKTKNNKSF